MAADCSTLRAWGRLLRAPNLFTVPGDVVAGYILASGGKFAAELLGACAAVLAVYIGGLFLNDYFDRQEDARERPERPIPSGALSAGMVLRAGATAMLAGVGLAWLCGFIAGLLALSVAVVAIAYDAGLKKISLLGPLLMGACRGGSVLIGAAFGGGLTGFASLPAALILMLYTAALTWNAAGEASGKKPGPVVFAPAAVLLAAGFFICQPAVMERPLVPSAAVVSGISIVEALWAAWLVFWGKTALPPFIGRLLRVMISVQAALVLWGAPEAGWKGTAAVIVGFGVLRAGSEISGHWFYGS